MTSWYDTSYRKLFFDFHSPGTTVGLARAFDAERWVSRLEAAHAQAVSVFTKCGFGYSFYHRGSVRYTHPQLPPDLDMVDEQITTLHRHGMKAIGYYHTFNSEPIAREHPDWVERDADGQPRERSICMLGPLTEAWMLPHIAEIVSLYDVDAMFFDGTYASHPCYCAACQQRFAEATGGLSLPRSLDDPNRLAYVTWKLQAFREVRQAICNTIHRIRPDLPVSFNWVYMPAHPEALPECVGTLVADIMPQDQYFESSYLARYWANLGRPFDIMNSAFLQWWGDWGCKPALAMQQEVAPTIANGGLTWIGYQMNQVFDVAPAVMEELGKTLAFVQEREPLLGGARPIPYVAALAPTIDDVAQRDQAFRADETGLRGLHRMLTESMIPYHLLTETTLLAQLPALKAVLLPDQRRLSPDIVEALRGWVQAGGVLLAAGLTGTLDEQYRETGRLALEDLLGVRLEGQYDQSHAYIEVTDERLKPGTLDMPHMVEAPFALARPVAEDVQVLAKLRKIYLRSDGQFLLSRSPVGEDSGYPAITLRRVGRGAAAYLAGDVFRGYQARNQWNLKPIVANLLNLMLGKNRLVEVQAPVWLEVVLMRQPQGDGAERTLIHLINPHGNRPVDKNNVCVEQILPVRDVTVRLRRATRPTRVTLEPGGQPADWQYAEGLLEAQVPQVYIHTAIAIE